MRRRATKPVIEEVEYGEAKVEFLIQDENGEWHHPTYKEVSRREYNSKRIRYIHHRMGMPFKLIPSCSDFVQKSSGKDWLMELYKEVVRPEGQDVLIRPWKNEQANRFLFSMFLALNKKRKAGDLEGYWKLGFRLLKSHVYQVSALNYVLPGWESGKVDESYWPLPKVVSLLEEVKKLAESKSEQIDIRRVYIPKDKSQPLSEENVRPLGVPSPAWRIYLHMLNNLIVWSRKGKFGSQHAYLPGRGVGTCWQALIGELSNPKWKYIAELDFTGYFDNVRHDGIYEVLTKRLRYPDQVAKHLVRMCKSLVKLNAVDLMEEPDRGVRKNLDGSPNPGFREDSGLPITEFKEYGVPQGAAISVSLATLVADYLTEKDQMDRQLWLPKTKRVASWASIFYADDFIVFSESPFELINLDRPDRGCILKLKKCKWLMREGRWETDKFKFLGLWYIPGTETAPAQIRAGTRKGSTLPLDPHHQELAWLLSKRERLMDKYEGTDLEEYLHREELKLPIEEWLETERRNLIRTKNQLNEILSEKWTGWILSKLYSGQWDPIKYEVPKFKWTKGSWLSHRWQEYREENKPDLYWSHNPPQWHPSHPYVKWNEHYLKLASKLTINTLSDWVRVLPRIKKNWIEATLLEEELEIEIKRANSSSFACHDITVNWLRVKEKVKEKLSPPKYQRSTRTARTLKTLIKSRPDLLALYLNKVESSLKLAPGVTLLESLKKAQVKYDLKEELSSPVITPPRQNLEETLPSPLDCEWQGQERDVDLLANK